MNERWRKLLGPIGYTSLFFLSFFFFVYLTFPYTILKEAVTARVARETGLDIRIDEFGPVLPVGFEARKVSIGSMAGGPTIQVQNAEVRLSLLNLLIGRIGVSVDLETKGGGTLDLYGRIGLMQLLLDKNFMPSRVELEAESFPIGPIVGFMLAKQANSPDTNPMISGLLTQIGLDGNLAGAVDLDIDPSNLADSNGKIDLQLKDSKLTISDPSLNLADQTFKKAIIKANVGGGTFKIADASGFHTQEMLIDLGGQVGLKNQLERSVMDLQMSLKLEEGLKDQFGFVLDMAGGSGGAVKFEVKGTVGNPNVVTM